MPESLPLLIPHTDKALVAAAGGARIALVLAEEQAASPEADVHVCLTGGSLGIGIWASLAADPLRRLVDWSRVHFWWSDERFLPAGDAERNVQQFQEAFLETVQVPSGHLHPMGDSDRYASPAEAAEAYAAELREHAPEGREAPEFVLSLLGMGPDGHMASLFPGREEILLTGQKVLPVLDSPKPPPERVSMSRDLIDSARRIWFLVAGADKADALGRLLAASDQARVSDPDVLRATPAAGARGTRETLYLAARDAIG